MAACQKCNVNVGCSCKLQYSNHWKLSVCLSCLIDGNNIDAKKLKDEITKQKNSIIPNTVYKNGLPVKNK